MAVYNNGKVYFTWVRGDNGHAEIATFTEATDAVSAATDFRNVQVDDHANAAIVILPDGKIMVMYSAHVGVGEYHKTSTNPEDISAFGSEVNLDSILGQSVYTYNQPIVMADDSIYRFYRSGDPTTTAIWQYTLNAAGDGVSWSAPVTVFSEPSEGMYIKAIRNGSDRIDFTATEKAPNAPGATQISVWHAYYDATADTYHQSDGTPISLPLNSSNMTLVYDGSSVLAAIEDIAIGSDGHPRIVFTRYVNVATDHRYDYARWTGSAWVVNEMAEAGAGQLESSGYYSGGVAIDRVDANRVYASINDGSQYEMHLFETADGGSTFSDTALTEKSGKKQIRPTAVQAAVVGGLRCLWMDAVSYAGYTNWNAGIRGTRE
jgi:hypothetical protein